MADNQNNSEAKPKFDSKRVRQAVMILAAIAVLIILYWLIFLRGVVASDDARVAGRLIDLIPESSGILGELEPRVQDSWRQWCLFAPGIQFQPLDVERSALAQS